MYIDRLWLKKHQRILRGGPKPRDATSLPSATWERSMVQPSTYLHTIHRRQDSRESLNSILVQISAVYLTKYVRSVSDEKGRKWAAISDVQSCTEVYTKSCKVWCKKWILYSIYMSRPCLKQFAVTAASTAEHSDKPFQYSQFQKALVLFFLFREGFPPL